MVNHLLDINVHVFYRQRVFKQDSTSEFPDYLPQCLPLNAHTSVGTDDLTTIERRQTCVPQHKIGAESDIFV